MNRLQKLMSAPTRSRSLRAVSACALVAALALGSFVLWHSSTDDVASATGANGQQPPASMELTRRPSLLVVGDDYASGYGGVPRNAYPYILCNTVGVNCNVDAQTGTGLLNDGRTYSPGMHRLIDRLTTDYERYNVDIVVVDAGRNDLQAPLTSLSSTLDRYLTRVGQLWPDARVVVLAPAQLTNEQAPDYPARTAAMSDVVARHRGILIDPAADGWYNDVDLSTIRAEDGLHPSPLGHQLIARKLGEALQRYGIIETDVG
jgi:lysophospholipase L1-like esterase